LIAVPLVIVGCFGVYKCEAERFAEAKCAIKEGRYYTAQSLFRELVDKFPDSEYAPEYRFLLEWAIVCGSTADPDGNLADAVEKLHRFIEDHKKDPLMEQKGRDAGQLLLRLSRAFAERNAPSSDVKIDLETAQSIEQLCRTVEGLGPDALSKPLAYNL